MEKTLKELKRIQINNEKIITILEETSFILILATIISPIAMAMYKYLCGTLSLKVWFLIIKIIGFSMLITSGMLSIIKIKSIRKQNKKNIINKKAIIPIIFFLIAFVLSIFATIKSTNPKLSFNGHPYTNNGLLSYILYCGFFLNAIYLKKDKIKPCLIVLIYISCLMCIVSLLNNDITYLFFHENYDPYNGSFAHYNHMGYYLSITTILAMFLFFEEKNKIFRFIYCLIFGIICYTLIKNNTLGSFLAVVVTIFLVLIYLIKTKKINYLKQLALIGIIFIFCSIFAFNSFGKNIVYENIKSMITDIYNIVASEDEKIVDETGTGRMILWKIGIKLILKKPILGYGPENILDEYTNVGQTQGSVHNGILQLMLFNGIPSAICYILALVIICANCIKQLKNMNLIYVGIFFSLISYTIALQTGVPFFYLMPYFYIFLGILFNKVYKNIN